jgi:hypothetical protein
LEAVVHIDAKWNYSLHPELKAVLDRLQTRFGSGLRLLPSDSEWLTFQVVGMTDEVLIRTLEREQQDIFGRSTRSHRVVRELKGNEPGVSISYVAGVSPDSGFWYY